MPIKLTPGYYSRAVVVELPDEKGRVRVRVPEFHGPSIKGSVQGLHDRDYIEDEDLPLADVNYPLGLKNVSLAINEIVYVTFPDCRIDYPLITGTSGSFMKEEATGKPTEFSEGFLTAGDSGIVWTGGTGSGSTMVSRARSLLGMGYSEPCNWYGCVRHWCAIFVSYVANLIGYIGEGAIKGASDQSAFGVGGIIPIHSSCTAGSMAFNSKGLWVWASSGYTPRSGDIIYFDWEGGRYYYSNSPSAKFNAIDHVAIVEKVENGVVTYIGGNQEGSGDPSYLNSHVTRCTISLSSNCIMGYGTPEYPTILKKVSEQDE